MVDTKKLREMLRRYEFTSRPSNGDNSAPCTVKDVNQVITNTTRLLEAFITEIEQSK